MPDAIRDRVLRAVRKLLPARPCNGSTDAELLRQFAEACDQAAFELIVWRHAAVVLNVCRRVLRDEHAAEDAFQATFLVLLGKAGSIRQGEALAGWLHRVAHRVALRARRQSAQQA